MYNTYSKSGNQTLSQLDNLCDFIQGNFEPEIYLNSSVALGKVIAITEDCPEMGSAITILTSEDKDPEMILDFLDGNEKIYQLNESDLNIID